MPDLNPAQFPPQYHVTTVENAAKIKARGGFEPGHSGGYGHAAANLGSGLYTSSEHAAEGWASNMIGYNPDVSLKKIPVEAVPGARVHHYQDFEDLPGGRVRLRTVQEHVAAHPDIAAHYQPPTSKYGEPVEHLARATKAAGYDALHVDRLKGWDETVWFDPSKVRPRA